MKYTNLFKTNTRKDESFFYYLDDNAKSLEMLVRTIHFDVFGGCLPNDWIYQQCFYAFEQLEQCDCERDYERALSEIAPDCYSHQLRAWLQEPFAAGLVDEEMEESGNIGSIDNTLGNAQIRAIGSIYAYVWEFICNDEQREEGEE